MAALQTIRNRGGLLISIVIGLALFAFIIGDTLTPGGSVFSGDRNQVGEIAGESVSIMDYQDRLNKNEEMAKMMSGTSALNEEQQTMLRNNTWQQLVMETLMGKEYEEIGLTVSGDELYDLTLGKNMSPMITQLFTDPNTGTIDKNRAHEVIKALISLPNSNPQKAYWLNLEKEIENNRKITKYGNLLAKSMFITDAQMEEAVKHTLNSSDISYIVKNYSSIEDSIINVSNSEIKDYYNKNLKRFKQAESRRIVFVNFDIEPSGEDFSETEKAVATLVEEFATTQDPIEFVNLTSDQKADRRFYKKEEISNDSLTQFLQQNSNGVFGPYLENNSYKISRIAQVKMLPDSVRARHILISGQTENYMQVADSLVNLLKKGANFETLARENSMDQNSAVNGGDLGWFTQNTMVQPFADTVFFAKKNDIKLVTTQFGLHIVQVTDMAKPVEKFQIATIEKEIIPSTKTTNNIYNNARTFASDINNLNDFNKKVEELGLTKRIASVSKNDRGIAGANDARELVRRIYMAEELGVVKNSDESIIFENNDKFTIAVLTEINEEGTAIINTVAPEIRRLLIQKKKAEILTKELTETMQGSESLLSVAQKIGTEVKEATDIAFSSFQIPGAGIEPKVIAAAALLEQGKLSAPIAGNQGVYLITVNSQNNEESTPEKLEQLKTAQQQSNLYRANYQAIQAILENGNIVDERYKFY